MGARTSALSQQDFAWRQQSAASWCRLHVFHLKHDPATRVYDIIGHSTLGLGTHQKHALASLRDHQVGSEVKLILEGQKR